MNVAVRAVGHVLDEPKKAEKRDFPEFGRFAWWGHRVLPRGEPRPSLHA